MTLRSKLLLAQVPLALALVLVGLLARGTIRRLDDSAQAILKDNYRSVLAAERMRDAVDGMARVALDHSLGRALRSDEAAAARQRFDRELAFQESNVTEAGEREMTDRLHRAWQEFERRYDRVLAIAPDERSHGAWLDELAPALAAVEQGTDDITAVNQDAMVRKSDAARASGERMTAAMTAATLGACLLGLLASMYLTSRLVRPLGVVTQAVRRVAQGDLDARARLDGHDEIARVAVEFNAMAQRLADYRRSSLGELLLAQQSAQATIDSLRDPVIILQLDGRVANVNQEAESAFGVREVSRGDALAAAPPAVRDTVARLRDYVASGKGPYVPRGLEEALPVPTREGTRYFLPRANPVVDEAGAAAALTVIFQDVTRLRRFDELKNDLVATVAHEFRTPLTSLRMAIHLCLEETVGPLTPKQAELLTASRDDCQRLQTMVDDLLDLSRIQAGRIELHRRAVSSRALVEAAVDAQQAIARERRVSLAADALARDRAVLVDPDRIDLVFTNLVQNALRHTPPDGRVEVRAIATDGANVRFEVSDTGAGIPAEHEPRLFERFSRVPGAPPGGAGLGLYICKEIVEAHGGRIGLRSAPGFGATFWFTVPAAPDQPASS